MAIKRYYFTEDDYGYFIRLFRSAEKLTWGYGEENASQPYCYIDIDLEHISEENKKKLGKDWKACLERLERDAKTVPPSSSLNSEKSFTHALLIAENTGSSIRKIAGIMKSVAVILFICLSIIFSIPGRISIRSDIQGGQKKNLDFMQLLQETVSNKPEKNNEARIKELLKRCQEHIRAKRLTEGEEGTALDCYREVLKLSPGNAEAQAGLQSLEMQYVLWAKNALRGRNVEKARQYLEGLSRVNPASPALAELTREISPSGTSPELSNTGLPADKPSPKKEADKPLLKKESKKPVPKKAKAKPSKKEKTKPSKKVKTKPSKKTQKRSGATEDFTEMSLGTDFNQKHRN